MHRCHQAWRRSGATRVRMGLGLLGLVVLAAGCSSSTPTDSNSGGSGPAPLDVFDVFLRPRAIMRAPQAGGIPNPQLPLYYLTAFYSGGTAVPTFQWQLDPALGQLVPKEAGLETTEAAVAILNGGSSPLGFYDISVMASSGSENSSLTRRIAVIENSWQKHVRVTFQVDNPPTGDLVSSPIFVPGSGLEIIYVESPRDDAVNLRRINAFTPLNGAAQSPGSVFVPPQSTNPTQRLTAAEAAPDLSPVGMGQNELLFSSQLDPDFGRRCPSPLCSAKIPFRLWVVDRPVGLIENTSKVLTQDSTFVFAGTERFYAFDYRTPKWDPTATGYPARIAYVSNVAGDNRFNIWLADLVDTNADNKGDNLVNHRQLTTFGGVQGFDWHPNGQTLYVTGDARNIYKVNPSSGVIEETLNFSEQDSLLSRPVNVSVFQRPGGHTLVAFKADSENQAHVYIYDEDDDVLMRVSPYPFPITSGLHPSWHPDKMWLTYVSDYTVNAWTASADTPPLSNANFARHPRTRYPSVWVLKLED